MAAKKDPMGQEVGSLYLSLGLDVSALELGFDAAGKTVRQSISRLNSEASQIRLRADIDVARLEAAGRSVDALRARERGLNEELAVQQRKLALLSAAYQRASRDFGRDAAVTRGIDTRRLYQERDIERLRARIHALNAEMARTSSASTGAFGRIAAGAAGARASVAGLAAAIGRANAAIATATAGAAAGYGLFSLADGAMRTGNDLYKLSSRLHATTAEAAALSKVFKLAGVDINSAIPLLARIDKQAASAGKSGGAMAAAMQEFGFALTDGSGRLLSYDRQLAQLAKGYRNAVSMGKEAEYVANVLGARGAALVPLLEDYETHMEIASRVESTGLLNPKEAHELYVQWQALQMQAGQLSGALGAALVPVVSGMVPEIAGGFKELAGLIRENKDAIQEFGLAAGTALGALAKGAVAAVSVLGDLAGGISKAAGGRDDRKVLEALGLSGSIGQVATTGSLYGGIVGGLAGGLPGAGLGAFLGGTLGEGVYAKVAKALISQREWDYGQQKLSLMEQERAAFAEYNKQVRDGAGLAPQISGDNSAFAAQMLLEEELSKATSKRLREQLQAIREKTEESIKAGQEEAEAWKKAEESITRAVKDARQEARKANDELRASIYKLSHTEIEGRFRDIDSSAQAMRDRGASEDLIARETELRKQDAARKFADETQAYLDSVFANSLASRLNQIEREKQAWIRKGLDEVTATAAAEKQKSDIMARENESRAQSNRSIFTSQRDALKAYASGGKYDLMEFVKKKDKYDSALADQIPSFKAAMKEIVAELYGERDQDSSIGKGSGVNVVRGTYSTMEGGPASEGGSQGQEPQDMQAAIAELSSGLRPMAEQATAMLPAISGWLAGIQGALERIEGRMETVRDVTVNNSLGGAYVFDDGMRQRLVDDIGSAVADAVTEAVGGQSVAGADLGFGG